MNEETKRQYDLLRVERDALCAEVDEIAADPKNKPNVTPADWERIKQCGNRLAEIGKQTKALNAEAA